MQFLKSSCFVMLLIYSGFSLASSGFHSQVIIGTASILNNPQTQPLLLTNHNDKRQWSYTSKMLGCNNISNIKLSAVKCTNNFCTAVGDYQSCYQAHLPLILTSLDNGNSWTAIDKVNGLSYGTSAQLHSIYCQHAMCVAVGNTITPIGNSSHLILVTQDTGRNWSKVTEVSDFPSYAQSSTLSVIDCSQQVCVAAGNYHDRHQNKWPLLTVSHDAGLSWSFIKNIAKLPNYHQSTFVFNSISCNGTTCAAGGFYNFDNVNLPLLIVSQDNGITWTFINNIKNKLSDFQSGQINMLTCQGNQCYAVGNYSNSDSIKKPFILGSQDNGRSWSFTHNTDLPNNLPVYTTFNTISCTNTHCFVGGIINQEQPLILMKHLEKNVWQSVKSIKGLPTVNEFKAEISSIDCKETTCTAIGTYQFFNGSYYQSLPLLITSHDNGLSWNFVSKIKKLPKNIYYTHLEAMAG